MLYVGFVSPHFPLIAPPEFYGLYPEDQVPWPDMYAPAERPHHPFTDAMRKCMCFDEAFDAPMVRRALAAYFGLVTFLDDNIGRILRALEEEGLVAETRVIYSSDHGDNLGTRGMWGKSTMYEESAGIPLIAAGEGVPAGQACAVPVTLADVFPTLVEGAGLRTDPRDAGLPGTSLFRIAQGEAPQRTILSEYHAAGAPTGAFMIRRGRYKYIHYVGMPPMLFDLEADPRERNDLGRDPDLRRGGRGLRGGVAQDRGPGSGGPARPSRSARQDCGARRHRSDPQEGHVPLFAAARGRSHLFLRISGRAP